MKSIQYKLGGKYFVQLGDEVYVSESDNLLEDIDDEIICVDKICDLANKGICTELDCFLVHYKLVSRTYINF